MARYLVIRFVPVYNSLWNPKVANPPRFPLLTDDWMLSAYKTQ